MTETEFEQQREALCKELSKWPVYISLESGAVFLGMDVCGEQKVSPEGFHLEEENGANLNSGTNEKIKFYQKDLTFSL